MQYRHIGRGHSRARPLTLPQQNPYPPLFDGIPFHNVNFWVRSFFRDVKGAGRPENVEKHKKTEIIRTSFEKLKLSSESAPHTVLMRKKNNTHTRTLNRSDFRKERER